MKTTQKIVRVLLLSAGLVLTSSFGDPKMKPQGGKCTGSKYCSACRNCSHCQHCGRGDVCGVCSPESFEPRKKTTIKDKSPLQKDTVKQK